MEKFWLIWSPEGFPPKYQHPSEKLAQQEAQRLAAINPSRKFFILEAAGYYSTEPVVTTKYHALLEIPF